MKTILFQGDSITDTGRNKENILSLGAGYANMTAGKILVDYPGQYQCINKGISGNRCVDLYARIKLDAINLKPDTLTVLIGVNDVWHEFSRQNGVSAPKFEKIVDMYLTEIKEALPQIQIIMLEPFVLPGTATEAHLEGFTQEVKLRAQACQRLAEKHQLPYVPLQEKLEALAKATSNDYVLRDGVHPTTAGHELISRILYDALKPIL